MIKWFKSVLEVYEHRSERVLFGSIYISATTMLAAMVFAIPGTIFNSSNPWLVVPAFGLLTISFISVMVALVALIVFMIKD